MKGAFFFCYLKRPRGSLDRSLAAYGAGSHKKRLKKRCELISVHKPPTHPGKNDDGEGGRGNRFCLRYNFLHRISHKILLHFDVCLEIL